MKPINKTIFGIPSCSCGVFLWMLANNFDQYRFCSGGLSQTVWPLPWITARDGLSAVCTPRSPKNGYTSCSWKMPSDVIISCRIGPLGMCDWIGYNDPDPNSSSLSGIYEQFKNGFSRTIRIRDEPFVSRGVCESLDEIKIIFKVSIDHLKSF